MILRNFYIQIDIPASTPPMVDYVYDFKKKSKHITNYINRECLSKYKFTSNTFNSFGINFRSEVAVTTPYIFNKSLIINLPFNKNQYDKCQTEAEFRTYIETSIREALNKIDDKHDVPVSTVLSCLNSLKANNYVNQWLHQRKTDRVRKIAAELHGSLTMEKFSLRLLVSEDGETVFNAVVLETDPDEIAFHYRFKNIVIEHDKIIVTAKTSVNLLEYSLDTRQVKMLNNK